MNISLKKIINYSFAMVLIASLSSCVKKEFDTPPTGGVDPEVSGTQITIAALKAMYTGDTLKVTSDVYIVGTVIGDDQSGNFYKEMVIQDSTAGISILLDQSDYWTTYKIGRRVFVKCNGLYLGEYNGIVQLGAGVDVDGSLTRIASTLITKFILPGSYYHYVTPEKIYIDQLTSANIPSLLNKLILIDTAQFVLTNVTFADAVLKQDINLDIKDCNDNVIVIRSSGYATFASEHVPTGNGSIVAVLQIYGSPDPGNLQLKIRDLNDLGMTGFRCGSIGPCNIDTSGTVVSLATVRCLYSAGFSGGLIGKKIRCTVISDKANANITSNNVAVQDATGGIVVRFTSANTFNLGDSIEVNVSGVSLTEFSGLLEFDATDPANATLLGVGTITPRTATIAEINTNFELWESTLVKVLNSTITGTQPYSGTKTLTDPTGTIDLYTRTSAAFAGLSFPTTTVSVTGILTPFNATKQISIRNTSDVQ